MPGSTVGLSLNYGFAGNVSRTPDSLIENRPVKSTSANIPFGAAVMLNADNSVSLADANVTSANFGGIAIAEVKQLGSYPASSANTGNYYAPLQPCDFAKRGIVNVKAGRGTPTAGGAVYIRTVLNSAYPASLIGDFESASDSGKNVLISSLCWNTGKVDANGIAELKLKYVNN